MLSFAVLDLLQEAIGSHHAVSMASNPFGTAPRLGTGGTPANWQLDSNDSFPWGQLWYIFKKSLKGNWAQARERSDQGLAVAPLEFRLLFERSLLEFEQGNFDEGTSYLDRMEEAARSIPTGPTFAHGSLAATAPIISRISGHDHGLDTARWAADVGRSSPSATPLMSVWALPGPSLNAVQQRDSSAARERYDALVNAPGKEIMIVLGISHDRLLGLLALTMAELDQAAQHFEDALTFCRKPGYRPELAWICCDYADTLLQRHSSTGSERTDGGDREKAMSLLDESLAISSELGMRPLMERVLFRREILKA